MMRRLSDWGPRLGAIVRENAARPHEYGRWDCLLWPAAAVEAIIGRDFGRGHRGKYDSLAKAYRHLQDMGFASAEALLDSLFDERPVGFARRGDLALCRTPSGNNPGVVIGSDALVVGEQGEAVGLVRVPRRDWAKAWAVGE